MGNKKQSTGDRPLIVNGFTGKVLTQNSKLELGTGLGTGTKNKKFKTPENNV